MVLGHRPRAGAPGRPGPPRPLSAAAGARARRAPKAPLHTPPPPPLGAQLSSGWTVPQRTEPRLPLASARSSSLPSSLRSSAPRLSLVGAVRPARRRPCCLVLGRVLVPAAERPLRAGGRRRPLSHGAGGEPRAAGRWRLGPGRGTHSCLPCAWRRGARSPRSVSRRSSSAVHVRPSRVCLWRTRLRAEHSAAAVPGGGAGGGTVAGAGAANLASGPRRGPEPQARLRVAASREPPGERPARSLPVGSRGECTWRAAGTDSCEPIAGPGRWQGQKGRRRREGGMPRRPLWLPNRPREGTADGKRRARPAQCIAREDRVLRDSAGRAPSPPHSSGPRPKRGGTRREDSSPQETAREGLRSDPSALSPPETRARNISAFPGGASGLGEARAGQKEGAREPRLAARPCAAQRLQQGPAARSPAAGLSAAGISGNRLWDGCFRPRVLARALVGAKVMGRRLWSREAQ